VKWIPAQNPHTSLSEGRHEIETARQRLTAAKAQASAAAQMMESAQLMSDAAKQEVLAASEGLKKAEERWNVINVDIDDDTATANNNNDNNEGSNKRRKVSVSPHQGSNANNSNINTVRVGGNHTGTRTASISTGDNTAVSSSSTGIVEQIVVEGCGSSAVNGIYSRRTELYKGAPVYYKQGSIHGAAGCFVIARNATTQIWYISFNGRQQTRATEDTLFYKSTCVNALGQSVSGISLPKYGWITINGQNPAPTCRPRNSSVSLPAAAVISATSTQTASTIQNGNMFQTAIDQHRDNTILLFKESAQRGESHVPVNKMEEARDKYLSAARAASIMRYPRLISEVELKSKMAEAEKEATSMYMQQIQRSKARAISSRVAAVSTAQTTQSNNNNNPATPATKTVLPKKKTELLVARIKKLVNMWANEEQMKGNNVFYWNILNNPKMMNVGCKVPTSMDQLASCDLSQNFIQQYGERLIKNINAFIEQENLQAYIHRSV